MHFLTILLSLLSFVLPSSKFWAGVNQTITPSNVCPDFGKVEHYNQAENWEEWIEIHKDAPGLLTSLEPSPTTEAQLIGWNTLWIPENQPFTLDYRIYYSDHPNNAEPISFRFIALLDEDIVHIEDANGAPFYELTLQAGEQARFQLAFFDLPSGIHNIVILSFQNPDEYPEIHDISPQSKRTTLVVGDVVSVESRPYTLLEATGVARELTLLDALGLGGDLAPKIQLLFSLTDDFLVWNYPENSLPLSIEQDLRVNFYVGYPFIGGQNQRETAKFAVRLFLNYEPLIIPPFESSVLYAEVTNQTAYSLIELHLPEFTRPGRYDLIAVRIDNPEVPYCQLINSHQSNQPLALDVLTLRVAIDVIE